MLCLSQQLSHKILAKHGNNKFQVEALLFGVAGFLNEVNDSYGLSLQEEFLFLKHKYKLVEMDVNQWAFMRLRPSSFPTLKIAQLAQLLTHDTPLFSKIIQANTVADLRKIIHSSVSEYWLTHYHFKKKSAKRKKKYW